MRLLYYRQQRTTLNFISASSVMHGSGSRVLLHDSLAYGYTNPCGHDYTGHQPRRFWRQRWQTAMNLPRSCRTSETPTSARTAALFSAASVSAFPSPLLPEGCAHHPAGRGHRQSGRGKRNCHSGGSIPAHKKQNRPHHRPPDAYCGRCGSGGGAVGRHRGRAGQPGRAVRPQGTVHPHG